jgi:tripartite-type tricarboxylate transporter receptor subunit TctC
MQYGSAGAGSATHLGCVLLNYLIGVDITHVPGHEQNDREGHGTKRNDVNQP